MLGIVGALAPTVEKADAAFGEDFSVVPINGPGEPGVAALPGASHFWWAGTCDRAAAPDPPAVGDPAAPIPGGIGALPGTVDSANQSPVLVDVPAPATPAHCIEWRWSTNPQSLEPLAVWTDGTPSWRLAPVARAGAHPDGSATFAILTLTGDLDNIYVDLPAGFVGDPGAVPKCSAEQFAVKPQQCPPESQVGMLTLWLMCAVGCNLGFGSGDFEYVPVYNLEPRRGNAAELGLVRLSSEGQVTARLVAKARTNGDFGVTTFTGQVPSALPVAGQAITIWGVPWAAHNDIWRAPQGLGRGNSGCHAQVGATGSAIIPPGGLPDTPGCRVSYDPSWGPIRPFLSNETDCNPAPSTRLAVDAYQFPGPFSAEGDPITAGHPDSGNWRTHDAPAPPVTGCESLGFAPDIDFEATSRQADAPSGLTVELDIPQNRTPRDAAGDPLPVPPPGAPDGEVDAYVQAATDYYNSDAGRATAHLKDTVVEFPDGVSVNPSAAAGLAGCSDAQIGLRELGDPPLFNNGDPYDKDGGADGAECPDAAKIGSVRVDTPLLDEPLTGEMVLGQPKSTDPTSGEMFRLFLVLRDPDRGLVAKVYGSTVADPATGRLRTTFASNPELPFDHLRLDLKAGPRGILALPPRCAEHPWSTEFTPWSSGPVVADGGAFAIDGRCGLAHSPDQTAGMSTQRPRAHGTFAFHFARDEGEPWIEGLTAKLPRGLLAKVAGVPLCTDAQAAAGSCPEVSRIGTVDAAAGSGAPFVLERKGEAFLTEGYKGCPFGLAVKVRAIAGPFRDALELSPIVVRQAICVNRRTSQVTAISDPLPLIHHGVPLRVREVAVTVDRDRFMLNPSGCRAKRVRGTYTADDGATADRTSDFQAAECRELAFRPRLAMRLRGRRQMTTGRHPAIHALVRQRGISEAGIRRATVRLPLSLALDPNNAQALCEFADGTRPDLENHCPKGSIVGRARAVSPLLNDPLVGNVYFVKNVRIDKRTGNEIRTLPMVIAALRGEVAINLRGNSNVRNRKLVSIFKGVPDAPVTRFTLGIQGGRNGILAVTRTRRGPINICKTRRQIAETTFNAHNGKRHGPNIRIKTPCAGRQRTDKRPRPGGSRS
jgi:hypothetical protein